MYIATYILPGLFTNTIVCEVCILPFTNVVACFIISKLVCTSAVCDSI